MYRTGQASTVSVPCSYGVGLGVLFASHGVIRACLLTFVAQATRWYQAKLGMTINQLQVVSKKTVTTSILLVKSSTR